MSGWSFINGVRWGTGEWGTNKLSDFGMKLGFDNESF